MAPNKTQTNKTRQNLIFKPNTTDPNHTQTNKTKNRITPKQTKTKPNIIPDRADQTRP